MPKRNISEIIQYHELKIKKLKERDKPRRRLQRVIYSDSSDDESDHSIPLTLNAASVEGDILTAVDGEFADGELSKLNPTDPNMNDTGADIPVAGPSLEADPSTEDKEPDLDSDFLMALGDPADESPIYGEKIHQTLADRWQPILRTGLIKDNKEKLIKDLAIPINCKLLRAPTLNPEISAAITEAARSRDKKLQTAQQQLGLGITAINRAMSILFTGDEKENKIQAIKILSDGCRILSDLHYMDTQSRIKLIVPALDKSFLNIIEDLERDESLFGAKLSDKIKASKAIEKQGLQIKKGVVPQKATITSSTQSTTRSRYQGNWAAPPRFHQSLNRGGRGGSHRPPFVSHRQAPPAQAASSLRNPSHNSKSRAAPRN